MKIETYSGQRGSHKNQRAKQRNTARKAANLKAAAERCSPSPVDQLAALDTRLGRGVGAKRERAKLSRLVQKSRVAA